ncbi:MBL fold metallo-hydrolase [Microlunatus endophyticus]|uniref:MBL fold metallo-hydrolase n=1 Tax=Microlunatus endophyticus TaxID=1716077 RepID=A0A917W4B5_9ACTN|nr:rhodanese-like domain-containing protein [Microlunatus endophyticus]GGL61390.1 MBL fold metallo-hydrolase [Microlunatus endophyticus]
MKGVPEIDVHQLAIAVAAGATVIDVREPMEYVAGHVPGAELVPMGKLPAWTAELDRSRPMYVICASGNRSATITDFLVRAGFRAWSVVGGTRAWVAAGHPLATGTAAATDLTVVGLDTPTLGDRSYLIHDGAVAFVVDPQRDIDRILTLLDKHQVRLTHVLESHIHNDYLTGGLALARRTGAAYLVNAEDEVAFERTPIRDGEVIRMGDRMQVTAVATPGHTYTHLSYVLTDSVTGRTTAVFSGGSLLFGATGRPDLLGPEHTDELVRLQHSSARRLAAMLPDDAEVFPTHGFGSFCSATQSEATASTIGREKTANPVLTQDEETYVRQLLDGLGAYPAYYAQMAPGNSAGPSEPDLTPPTTADPVELRRRIEAGEWIVDLRHRTVFAAGHLPGSLNFGLDGSFATYLGWLMDRGTPLTLLAETAAEISQAQRELVRIGIDRPAAAAIGGPQDWVAGTGRRLGSFPTATFAELAQVRHHRPVVTLDVRRADEFSDSHIDGAINIPIHELPRRIGEVPDGEVWVHCAGGYRASVAASFLARAGRRLVAVDDTFDNAVETGLPITDATVGPA